MQDEKTIVALATAQGSGAIGMIRLSGNQAINIAKKVFFPKKAKDLSKVAGNSVHLGDFKDGQQLIDEVLCTVFKAPHSYTGEQVVEFSCHGSAYIQQQIIKTLLKQADCRIAEAGEFTLRAFLNGKMDLSQAEAVADLINCQSAADYQIALQQMRGGIRNELEILRQSLLDFTALIELELDFAEEDVNFADRGQFKKLLQRIRQTLKDLIDSFHYGNALKAGIPVAIVGAPNTGKSTLLNTLAQEEKAIVSSVEGTTRDAIENECIIKGIRFRFVDTAGIRATTDAVENIGIEKTYEKARKAQIILLMVSALEHLKNPQKTAQHLAELCQQTGTAQDKIQLVFNKIDLLPQGSKRPQDGIAISAKENTGIKYLKKYLVDATQTGNISNAPVIVSNIRHYEALTGALNALNRVNEAMNNDVPSDLFAIDIRECLQHLGNITGTIDVDQDILGHIFANFCIGK